MQKFKIPESEFHQSIRGYCAGSLYNQMIDNDRIRVVTADLGYGMFDKIRDEFPDRFYNVGASEQAGMGICIGMALDGLIPFFYSISSFLIYRPFEFIRNYVDHERIPVRLIGSGFDDDYKHDGITHQPFGLQFLMECEFPNVKTLHPDMKEQVPDYVKWMVENDQPSFICLRR